MAFEKLNPAVEDAENFMVNLIREYCSADLLASIEHHLSSGGKRLRARLAIAATNALGVQEAGPAWAAACELLHNATLVHDDLQDGDTLRRGKPTVWSKFGKAESINTGDFMLLLPTIAIGRISCDDGIKWRLAEALAQSAVSTVRGQSGELELPKYLETQKLRPLYFKCIAEKTSSLFELPIRGAALLSGLSISESIRISSTFQPMGSIFQLQDDILDLFGQKGRQVVGADLYEGKISSLVVSHLALYPDELTPLMSVVSAPREETRPEDVAKWIEEFRSRGALSAVLEDISIRRNHILESSVLKESPQLMAIAEEMVGLMMEPIKHVRSNS